MSLAAALRIQAQIHNSSRLFFKNNKPFTITTSTQTPLSRAPLSKAYSHAAVASSPPKFAASLLLLCGRRLDLPLHRRCSAVAAQIRRVASSPPRFVALRCRRSDPPRLCRRSPAAHAIVVGINIPNSSLEDALFSLLHCFLFIVCVCVTCEGERG
ncbi:hypothetical protein Salat_2571100 [Sesamum alatum]|uniref:Uncharacterized protein n=1 Tax=Sesamum alatum TaxID=300844 RepID=A0AAE2CCX0_9LAMI|nr:hypothetical protein Salat_2571100 [Sesamum alatum]